MKKVSIAIIVLAIIAIAMPTMAQSVSVPQIQTGTFSVGGATLENGTGERQVTSAISFKKGFAEKPQVMVAMTMIDASGKEGVRVLVQAEGISRDGFTVVAKTWADSKVHSINGTWIAVGSQTVKVK